MSQGQMQPPSLADGFRNLVLWVSILIGILAAPYRLLAHRLGSMGKRAVDLSTVLGVLIAYPLIVQAGGLPATPEGYQLAVWGWALLFWLIPAHKLAAHLGRTRRHTQEIGLPWGGDEAGEFVLAAAASIAAGAFCTGVGAFIAIGWLANLLQRLGIYWRFVRSTDIAGDAEAEAEIFRRYMNR